MASAMLSRIKEDGCEVQAIHADNDSKIATRKGITFHPFPKKQVKNYLNNSTKQL